MLPNYIYIYFLNISDYRESSYLTIIYLNYPLTHTHTHMHVLYKDSLAWGILESLNWAKGSLPLILNGK